MQTQADGAAAPPAPPRALIVGAAGGLGQALVRRYEEAGFAVRRVTRADADLADPAAVERLAVDPALGPFEVCLLAAGTSEAGYLDALDPAAFRRCLEVNFLAPVALVTALARRDACRRFVFVLSGAADFLVPGLGPYALSKRCLRDWLALADLERSFPRCRFLPVWPGGMETAFDARTRRHGDYELPRGSAPRAPAEVAARIFAAERAGRTCLDLARLPRLLGWLQAVAPRAMRMIVRAHPRLRRRPPL
jgi:NAD(P)-dependent dehydrogenase (short-subunit alcohol dehydrogenase family)